ncbi:MAG: hypothetical protein Q8P88_03025 [Candidatus Jorgensenbacteria bacterium]|nr:hypothetical protein [Candidatus Jorgensenbacteria bacterium]
MKERTREILETAVHDFIEEGRPITSEYLYAHYDFGIKPAMIRWELQALAGDGFFYQARPSGGRFPTRKAYKAYVDSITAREEGTKAEKGFRPASREMLPKQIAEKLHLLGAGYDPGRGIFREWGLANLVSEFEEEARGELMTIVRDIERIEERLAVYSGHVRRDELWPKVFVGETPLTESKLLSIVMGRSGAHEPFFFLAVGPLRMDYEKSLALFHAIDES